MKRQPASSTLWRRLSACLMIAMVVAAATALLGCQAQPGNGGGDPNDFLNTGRTATSTFQAMQIDPRAEDSAGPQFAAVGDFNDDGLIDVASAWNQSTPIQIHVQQRTLTGAMVFATIPVGGTTPIANVSGLKVADLDGDGLDDIVVLVKDTGGLARCDESREDCDVTDNGGVLPEALSGAIVLFFNPDDVFTQPWTGVTLAQSQLAGTPGGTLPLKGGYTSVDVGDIDGVNGPDIVVALNRAEGDPATDDIINSVDFYPNPGGGVARNAETWARIPVHGDIPSVGAVRISDVDSDGDNDIVASFPTAKNANVRWVPNPLNFGELGNVYSQWPAHAPIGQVATGADAIDIADIDGDGFDDVLVCSIDGKIIQWFRRPAAPSHNYIRNPRQVYSIAEFGERAPAAVALGDITGDGGMDAAIAAGGAVAWFSPYGETRTDTMWNFWQETLLIDDDARNGDFAAAATDPNAEVEATGATFINTLIVVDMDGDGFNDIIATLDRGALSGLSNDALVLFRNMRGN
jgi:hypothetical protein